MAKFLKVSRLLALYQAAGLPPLSDAVTNPYARTFIRSAQTHMGLRNKSGELTVDDKLIDFLDNLEKSLPPLDPVPQLPASLPGGEAAKPEAPAWTPATAAAALGLSQASESQSADDAQNSGTAESQNDATLVTNEADPASSIPTGALDE